MSILLNFFSSRFCIEIRLRCANLVRGAKDKRLRVKEPFQIPTKVANITRKSPYQEGITDPNILAALTIPSPLESTFTVAATGRNNQGDRDIEDGSGNEIDELDMT
ncbi:40S ribosomal protein S20-1 [Capsicum annuum]|nr:40S ribosomal protein S20-1 [Capsicum annuum]KAF3657725.1 40S ribosomal protein S20-1 [Capsicum annuum]